jgi:hypothetical protein
MEINFQSTQFYQKKKTGKLGRDMLFHQTNTRAVLLPEQNIAATLFYFPKNSSD